MSRLHRKRRSQAKGSGSVSQFVCRLPAGGPDSSCDCNKQQSSQMAEDYEPNLFNTPVQICTPPSDSRRTTYVADDELDPELGLRDPLTSVSTQTLLLQTQATQTEDLDDFEYTEKDPNTYDKFEDSEKVKDTEKEKKRDIKFEDIEKDKNTDSQFEENKNDELKDNSWNYYYSNKKLKKKMLNKPHNFFRRLNFLRRTAITKSASIIKDESVHSIRGLATKKRNSTKSSVRVSAKHVNDEPHKEYRKSKLPEVVADNCECTNCELLPEISRNLSQLKLNYDKQMEHVQEVRKDIKTIKTMISDNGKNAPPAQQVNTANSYQKNCMGIVLLCDASTSTNAMKPDCFCPTKRLALYKQLEASKALNVPKIKNDGPTYSKISTPDVPQSKLPCQKSSTCPFCSDKNQPVLDELVCEALKLIDKRHFEEILLTIFLRADNVYHVTVQVLITRQVLGCILVTDAAIQEANRVDFFQAILTFHVFDVRNTIGVTNLFGIPFEFNPRNMSANETLTKDSNKDCPESMDPKVCEFITKVLELPADTLINNSGEINDR